jgi:hypothetical protein
MIPLHNGGWGFREELRMALGLPRMRRPYFTGCSRKPVEFLMTNAKSNQELVRSSGASVFSHAGEAAHP